jgi:putative two-component system response regulator
MLHVMAESPPQVERTSHRALIVDDEAMNRVLCRRLLQGQGLICDEASDGADALRRTKQSQYDLILLDVDMPGLNGTHVLQQLREEPPSPNLKIIMFSGRVTGDELAFMMRMGADDFINKPFSIAQLRERVRASLRLKQAQDRSDELTRNLLTMNGQLEKALVARDCDLVAARNALVMGLAELVACRDSETGAHLHRIQKFSRVLAERASAHPVFSGRIDEHFVKMVECCAPLHDIGKVGVPDHILLKPGRLTPDERVIMEQHTVLAASTLKKLSQEHGFAVAFLQIATEIARHHHERYDGKGYPDRLAGENIPLSARIVAIADVYDALRSKRVYKPAFSHQETLAVMGVEVGRQFDPALLTIFLNECAHDFERIFAQYVDEDLPAIA